MGRGGENALLKNNSPGDRINNSIKVNENNNVVDGEKDKETAMGPLARKLRARFPDWYALADEFTLYHQNSFNVFLHMVTTPAGIWAALALITKAAHTLDAKTLNSPNSVPFVLIMLYYAILKQKLPKDLWVMNSMVMFALGTAAAVAQAEYSFLALGVTLAVSYFGQDVAHWLTGEKTYDSTYMTADARAANGSASSSFASKFMEHTVYLMPLVLHSAYHCPEPILLSWMVPRNYVVFAKLTSTDEKSHLKRIRDWALAQNPRLDATTHWWFERPNGAQVGVENQGYEVSPEVKESFEEIMKGDTVMGMFTKRFDMTSYEIAQVRGMNELYVAGPPLTNNSDKVFESSHVDGPYRIFPFCYLFRCMLATTGNSQIRTNFNFVTTYPENTTKYTLADGDVVGFDFNREIHYIDNDPDPKRVNKDPRVNLKLHYVVYPKCMRPFGKLLAFLTTRYNVNARNLFLNTIRPKTWRHKFNAKYVVLWTTEAVYRIEQFASWSNVAYVALASLLPRLLLGASSSYPCFVALTSFVHYIMYISVYYLRDDVSYGSFKRDVMFFKVIAYCHLVSQFASAVMANVATTGHPVLSYAMMAVGYGLASSAAMALGVDRTYFGSELGHYPPKWITAFPYSLKIPHPMIVGGIIGLSGFQIYAPFRLAIPWLIPAHIAFYMLHMLQEHFDIIAPKSRGIGKTAASASVTGEKKVA